MTNSSYYYSLYKQEKSAVNSYDDNLKDLRKVLNNLTDTMNDEIRAINNELNDLKSDLKKSIRHNSKFTSRANAVTTEKENNVAADPNLSIAVREIEEEIAHVSRLKNTAIHDRDYHYREYKEKKEQEHQDFLDKFL